MKLNFKALLLGWLTSYVAAIGLMFPPTVAFILYCEYPNFTVQLPPHWKTQLTTFTPFIVALWITTCLAKILSGYVTAHFAAKKPYQHTLILSLLIIAEAFVARARWHAPSSLAFILTQLGVVPLAFLGCHWRVVTRQKAVSNAAAQEKMPAPPLPLP